MFKKLLNNFRGRNRPTQVLVVFLVVIVVMTVLKKTRESLTAEDCMSAAEKFKAEGKTEDDWKNSEIGKSCRNVRNEVVVEEEEEEDLKLKKGSKTAPYLSSDTEMICERKYPRGRGSWDSEKKVRTLGLRCKPASWSGLPPMR